MAATPPPGHPGRSLPPNPTQRKATAASGKEIKKRKNLTYAVKLEIVKLVESGQSKISVGAKFGINESTVRGIYLKKDHIKAHMNLTSDTAGYNAVRSSNHVLLKTEQLLSKHFDRMAKRNLAVDTKEAMDTAKEIYKGVAAKWGIQQPQVFFASKGWFDRFIARRKIPHPLTPNNQHTKDTDGSASSKPSTSKRKTLRGTLSKRPSSPETSSETSWASSAANSPETSSIGPSERELLYDEDLDLKTEIKEELVEDVPNFVDMHQLETSSELMDDLEDVSITDVLAETKSSSSRATTNTSLENVPSSAPKFDNGDEFHLFGMFVASQLRALPLRDALQTQLEIQTIIAQKRSQRLT